MDVRHSEVKDFLRCRKRWDYRWNRGLKPKKQNNKLFFGTLFHKWLQDFYGQESYTLSEYIEGVLDFPDGGMGEMEYQEILDLFAKITTNYWNAYRSDFDNWEVIATELTFKIPLDDEISYTGTIDLIVRDKNDGKIYFLDHKTTGSIDSYDKNSDMDTQISRYWWALQQLQQGEGSYLLSDTWFLCRDKLMVDLQGEIGGFIYNIILKDYPRPPKVLKDGSLSKAKNQNTTLQLYVEALADKGLAEWDGSNSEWVVPNEYADMYTHLAENPREYFRRVNVIRTQSEIDASMEELYAVALDMKSVRWREDASDWRDKRIYRNITKDCHWDCPFMEICKASLDGSNVDFLIEELFTKEEM